MKLKAELKNVWKEGLGFMFAPMGYATPCVLYESCAEYSNIFQNNLWRKVTPYKSFLSLGADDSVVHVVAKYPKKNPWNVLTDQEHIHVGRILVARTSTEQIDSPSPINEGMPAGEVELPDIYFDLFRRK